MNSNPGPPWLSCAPAVAMAGMITSAASMAAIVSKSATRPAAPGISSSSGRYEPYIRVPFPATESEKNACPSANIHVFGSASTFGSMRKMYLYPSMAPGWHAALYGQDDEQYEERRHQDLVGLLNTVAHAEHKDGDSDGKCNDLPCIVAK